MSTVTPNSASAPNASMAGRLTPNGPVFKQVNIEQINRRKIDGSGKNTSETVVKGMLEREGVTEDFNRKITIDHLKTPASSMGASSDLKNLFKEFEKLQIPVGDLSIDLPQQKTDSPKPDVKSPRGAAELPIIPMQKLEKSALPEKSESAELKKSSADPVKRDDKKTAPEATNGEIKVAEAEINQRSKSSTNMEKIAKKAAI